MTAPVLSFAFTTPVKAPAVAGVEVTEMLQLAPAARVFGLIGQVFVCEKLPFTVMVLRVSAPVVVFVSVAVCGELCEPMVTGSKLSEVGLNSKDPVVPVPVSGTDCGLPEPL